MLEYTYLHRVRYRECDPMNLVYHGHYLDYFEYARTDALRAMGLAYRDLEASGVLMPVIEVAVQYKRPALYDDLLEIVARFPDGVPRMKVRIEYTVRRTGDPTLLVAGHVTLCFVDAQTRRAIPAPPLITTVFERALAEAQQA
jgi:acyl-CoA thioester hydrolase